MANNRPELTSIPVEKAMHSIFGGAVCVITMSPGQWDSLLEESYKNGFILLEIDEEEMPVAAYHKEG